MRVAKDGTKLRITLTPPIRQEIVQFVRSLPAARFSPASQQWTATASPLACAMLFERGFTLDDAADEMCAAWQDRLTLDEAEGGCQPRQQLHPSWRHQATSYWFAFSRPAAILAIGMGGGKSKVAVDVIVNRGHRRTLIVCPKSVVPVWRREFAKHCIHRSHVLCLDEGPVAKRASRLLLHLAEPHADCEPVVAVINYDSCWRSPLDKILREADWDLLLLDESHRAKAPGGTAAKFLSVLAERIPYKLALSGTPMPHSPLDIYAQARILEPALFGTSYQSFRSRYAVTHPEWKSKVLRWINQDEFAAKLAEIMIHFASADVLDLPPITHNRVDCALAAKAARTYKDLEERLVAEIEEGEVTANNALTKLLRLQQITSGVVTTDGGGEVIVDTSKLEALTDLLEDIASGDPVVVFCRFRHDLKVVRQVAESLGRKYGELSGSQRDLTDHAEMPEGIDVYGVQIQSGGVGIDLTRARYGIYYSVSWSLGEYDQSIARLHRPGQERPTIFYHLVCRGTVDESVYEAFDAKREVVDFVLTNLKTKEVGNEQRKRPVAG